MKTLVAALILILPLGAQRVSVVSVMPASGSAMWGRLSADGSKLVYLEQSGLRVIDPKAQKTFTLGGTFQGALLLQLAPDGRAAYVMAREAGSPQNIFRVSIPDGQTKKILSDVSRFSVSLDGQRVLFGRSRGSCMIADSEGQQEQTLLAPGPFYSFCGWEPSGLVHLYTWSDQQKRRDWTIDPRTLERREGVPPDSAARSQHPPFGIENTGYAHGNPRTDGTWEISWGRICRFSAAGKVLERLTPEKERYVKVLPPLPDGTLLALRLRPPEFWDGLSDWLFQYETVTSKQFELVTLKLAP
jgi:hypothetical protein